MARTAYLIVSNWTCVDGSRTTSPTTTEVQACGDGYRQDTTTMGSANCVPTTAEGTSGIIPPKPISCEGTWNNLSSPGHLSVPRGNGRTRVVLITLTAWLLEVVGLLFNYLLFYTVIAFGDADNGFLTKDILAGINATGTVFRDIANILIIGLFTFIAISTILGNHEFGAKKMLAKALIIAVLINFSLLFTKMIIDVSNFTAYQFYNAAGNLKPIGSGLGNTDSNEITNASTLSFTQDGIAGQFIKYLGVTSFTDVLGKLRDGADKADNGWVALLHGLFGATMLLATAAVLLYGSFLLVSRAILIVFLLITSSLAFAAYLLPKSLQARMAGVRGGIR